ncbi:MAG: MBOAT family protein, partial [Myxococcota bacterium]
MLFNSKIFITFLAIVLLVYYPLSDRAKIGFLLVMSYIFYGFWDPLLCSLIALSTVVDFWCGRNIHRITEQRGLHAPTRKLWLYLSLSVNLGLLGFFKYADFFITEFV